MHPHDLAADRTADMFDQVLRQHGSTSTIKPQYIIRKPDGELSSHIVICQTSEWSTELAEHFEAGTPRYARAWLEDKRFLHVQGNDERLEERLRKDGRVFTALLQAQR